MNELALFAGAGGGILGGRLCGFRTVCAVEIEAYARQVLMARQDDGCLEPFPIWDDVTTFDGKPWRGVVDIISGGFPCQDISAAGKGAGIDGERSGLWSEMSRIIGEVRPRNVLVENSPVLTSRGLGTVLRDLAKMGYDARWGVLGAVHAGAPHKRERIWIVANDPKHGRRAGRTGRPDPSHPRESEQPLQDMADASRLQPGRADQRPERERTGASGQPIDPDANGINDDHGRHGASPLRGEQGRESSELRGSESDVGNTDSISGRARAGRQDGPEAGDSGWWLTEPDVGRVAHGVASRVDRLRCLGNGQVPAVVPLAWRLLSQMNAGGMAAGADGPPMPSERKA